MTAATRLVHALAGTPEPIASQAAHLTGPGGTCCICGEHADRLAPAARTLGASFTDRAMFRDPTADGVCPACLWCASGKPPATVRMWTVIAAPGVDLGPSQPKAWIQDTPGLLLTSRADTAPLARILGDPPPGPWTVSVALSGQKHVLPYADVNHGAGRWTIRVETADVTATLHTPLHHGAGTAGNTAILRTHDVIQPDGTTARVPYLSGNSIRNRIRSHLAWRLIEILDVQPGTLTKPVVDLLWSGGAITATGAQVDLGIARDVEILIPHVAMLGYAARSDIVGGTLRARDWLLVCAENAWRLPAHLRDGKRAAAYRGEEFGTRHDIASTPVARLIATAGDLLGDHLPTTQMIYDRQVLLAGARMWGTLDLTPAATPAHRTALEAALALWAPDGVAHVGANTAQGRGVVHLDGLPDTRATAFAEWEGALTGRRDEILGLLAQVTG